MNNSRYPMLPSRAGRQILAVLAAQGIIERGHKLWLHDIEGRLYRTNFKVEGELESLVIAGYVEKDVRFEYGELVTEYEITSNGLRVAMGVLAQLSA